MNDTPPPDDPVKLNIDGQTLRIGEDGELIPEDELGKPVYLSGAPMIKTDEATIIARILYIVAAGLVLLFLGYFVFGTLYIGQEMRRIVSIAIPTRTSSSPATPTHSSIFNSADIPRCMGSYALSIYTQVEVALDRYILRFQVNGAFCNLLLHPIPDEVIHFDADGSGAIFRSLETGAYYHGRFADGHIYAEPYLDPPPIPAPRLDSAQGSIFRADVLWLYGDDRTPTVLEMPWWVTGIVWAEWVSRPD